MLQEQHIRARVVSMPSWDQFDGQPRSYREQMLLSSVRERLAVDWHRYMGDRGDVLRIDRFGALAPGDVVMREKRIRMCLIQTKRVGKTKPDTSIYSCGMLQNTQATGRARAQRVSFFGAHQPDRPKTRLVAFARDTQKLTGFLALPSNVRRHRAIIVIHEWWGLNEWVKEQAEKLATNGYVTLAVDLYRGKVATDRSEARKLKRGLRQEQAIGDLRAAFNYLVGRPDVDPKHIGSLGWSMGGGLAVQFAIHEPRLAACVVNYGPVPTNAADIRQIDIPVLGIFGALDRVIPLDKVRAFEKCMKAAGKRVDIEVYDSAGHSFENPSSRRGYRPKAAADAWSKTLKFFGQTNGSSRLSQRS
jgi:carboxymethylenebutenolidase